MSFYSLPIFDINKAIQVFLHILVCLMIYAFLWSIYIWSYVVCDSRSLFSNSVMLLWFHMCSLKLGRQGSEQQRSIRRERNQARNQAQDWGWCPSFPSYPLLIKENKSSFSLFVSKIATSLSGTSNSEWALDFPITKWWICWGVNSLFTFLYLLVL